MVCLVFGSVVSHGVLQFTFRSSPDARSAGFRFSFSFRGSDALRLA
jgi:hypothetical protein